MSELTNKTNENRLFFDKIIDGFFVPSMMQKWWAVSYKNFTELDSECRKEGYDAYGMWGTMLGCVRNSGFIPWDDDFDSLMFREMFNKLYYRGKKGELPKEYWISDYEYNQNENMVRTWVDTKSIIRKPEDRKDNYGFALYNPIDIFILDTLPRDEEERKAHYMVVESYATLSGQAKLLAEQKRNGTDGLDENEIIDEAQLMENIRRLSKSTGIELEDSDNPLFVKLYKAMDEFCSRYKQGQGNLLTIIAYMINIEGFQYDKSLFAGSVNLPFDHGTIPLPISYDQILRMSYGDYMCPTLMGGVHGYPVYDSMEEQMRKKANIEYHKFRYDKNAYRAIVDGRKAKISVSTQVKNSIELFGDAHRFIQSKCANGDVDETLLDVLGQCQDLAVSVGERVETDAVGGEDIVKEFEKYCGDIYELYQLADDALSGAEVSVNKLVDACERMIKYEEIFSDISNKTVDKKEVVLLCYRAKNWQSLHTIYEELSKRNDTNVVVIRVPYYERKYDGTVDKNEMIIETEGYPEGIIFTDYDKYDFENRHPDVIVDQWPYDDYNESIYMHPYYFSSNLYLHTEKMVLIPPFVTKEAVGRDKLWVSLSSFLRNPGALYSDMIVAQSDTMAAAYADNLDDFMCKELTAQKRLELMAAGDEQAAEAVVESQDIIDFSTKVSGAGSALYDWKARTRTLLYDKDNDVYYEKSGEKTTPDIYDEVYEVSPEIVDRLTKPDGSFRKIMAFFPGGSALFSHGKPALEKMKSEVKKAIDNDDILVWWYVDPYAREILKNHAKDTWIAFRAYRDEFEKEGWGILDESWDDTLIKNIADFIYGDGCAMMNHIREAGKPVLWETPAHPLIEKDGYETKEWTPDLTIVTDRQWTMENFLDEAMKYEPVKPEDGNAARIVEELLRR